VAARYGVTQGIRTTRVTSPTRLVLLLSVGVFINYVDRGNLATAAPLIQGELHLSASQLGVLLSAFYYGYVLAMAPVGWFAEKYGAKRVLATGAIVWSIATLFTGVVSTFAGLLLLRLLMGGGESVAFPCASKLLAQAVPVSRLGLANGVLSFGYLLGPAIGTLLGGLLMTRFGWRPVFILFGVCSLAWLLPWRGVVIAPAAANPAASQRVPSFSEILKQRALWGAAIGLFSGNYGFYFILAWLPFYLVKTRGFSIEAMAWTASWAYLLNAVSALFMGWLTDSWVRGGRSPTVVYKGVMGLFNLGGIACMIGMVLLPTTGSIAVLFVYEVLAGLSSPAIFAIPQIIAGPHAAGRWVGVQNAAGGLAGLIAPAITGVLVDRTGHFGAAFALAAALQVTGFIGWVVVLPKIVPLRWAETRASALQY
jgi:MFS family permease